ncbi:protein of unknown function [Rhodovastum atsumiense]|nr:protein of unknown function [Rhodovastum atsumiense]
MDHRDPGAIMGASGRRRHHGGHHGHQRLCDPDVAVWQDRDAATRIALIARGVFARLRCRITEVAEA